MSKRVTTADFIQRARKVHGNRYDYSKVLYIAAKRNVTIICPEHGEFKQLPPNHYIVEMKIRDDDILGSIANTPKTWEKRRNENLAG